MVELSAAAGAVTVLLLEQTPASDPTGCYQLCSPGKTDHEYIELFL